MELKADSISSRNRMSAELAVLAHRLLGCSFTQILSSDASFTIVTPKGN